ncbi:MAG: hypothetical protein V1909_00720 [Candidatus Micrarchaeota archaeon]
MYLSTSRKPSILSKRLCKTLSALLPRGIYENRGKKSIEEVADRARKLGKSRVLLLYEHHGNPDKFQFMDVGKNWEWLSPEVKITKLGQIPQLKSKTKELRLEGEKNKEFANLFNLESSNGEEEVRLILSSDNWSFYSGSKKLFSIGVSYGIQGDSGNTV